MTNTSCKKCYKLFFPKHIQQVCQGTGDFNKLNMSWTNIFDIFQITGSRWNLSVYLTMWLFMLLFRNIYSTLLTTITIQFLRMILTWTIGFLFIDHVFTCVWKKNGVILSIEVNSNKVWRAPCYRYDHIFLGGEIEWDPPHCQLGWKQQELLHSCKRKDQTVFTYSQGEIIEH